MINRERMVFFNIAYMEKYQGDWENDIPINGGSAIGQYDWGGEVYNFQPYKDRERGELFFGFVEPGRVNDLSRQRNLNISRINRPTSMRHAHYVSDVSVVWVATPRNGDNPVVVGWYKKADLYSSAQIPPLDSNRPLPGIPHPGEYFAVASANSSVLIPKSERTQTVPGKGVGFGRSNIWYAQTSIGETTKDAVLRYILQWERTHQTNPHI